jgi:nicotinamide mononucleotide (NMN) deamidase PncC
VRVQFEVAPGQDARMAALRQLGQVSRELAGQVREEGLELFSQDFEISYVGQAGKPSSVEEARGGTVCLKARTSHQAIRRSGVVLSPDPYARNLLELAAALAEAAFGDISAAVDVAKE